jgi:hypothetical protein
VLKSIWLEGKRNQRVDHLIHMLMEEFLPDLEIHHEWQMLGMEGPNLRQASSGTDTPLVSKTYHFSQLILPLHNTKN